MEKPKQWERIKEIVGTALEKELGERSAFLDGACGQDAFLRAEVESLLAAYEDSDQPSEHPWVNQLAGAPKADTIGPYKLLRRLGEGGMGQVWLADQTAPLKRQVALKLIRGGMFDSSALQRFHAERQSLAMMDHPSIAKVFDAGATPDGQPYFVMEYVPGVPITEYCDQKRLKIVERLKLFIKVCDAVQHAHQKAIIHRDLKPANILVQEIDGKPVPRIIDFGLAKATSSQLGGESLHTQIGSFVGTPGYMSPEQCGGTAMDVDTRSDVYSLGVVMYVLLTGCLPFQSKLGKDQPLEEMLRVVREEDPPSPSSKVSADRETSSASAEARGTEPKQLVGLLRGDLDWITMKALEKDRSRRYGTTSELAAEIARYLNHEPVLARPASVSYRLGKYVRRHRTAVALASATFAALVVGVTGTVIQAQRARVQRDFAFQQMSRAEAVSDLENFVLHDAPRGKKFTVEELLDRAEQIVERAHGPDANRVELLVSIGLQYTSQDEATKARRVLEYAYQLSRGLQDHSVRANASCALGTDMADAGEVTRAEALFQEGILELPNEPQYVLDRASCLQRGREIAGERGDAKTEIERAQAALQLLRESPFHAETAEASAFRELAEAYRDAGRYTEAIAAFEQASTQFALLGRDNTENAGTLYNNWAFALYQAGRPLEAEELFRRAIEITADRTEAAVSPMLLLNYAKPLQELKRLHEAADYAERANAKAQKAGDEVVVNQSLLELARIYREQRNFTRAAEVLQRVEPRLRRNLPPGHYAFAALASERSLLAYAQGDLKQGLRLANEAVTIDETSVKSGGQGAGLLPILLSRRSALELEAGQPEEAAADAIRALDLLKTTVHRGVFSCYSGRAYLALGRALQAQGNADEARAAFRSAAEHLEKTLGPDHPESRAARLETLVEHPNEPASPQKAN